MSNKFYDGDTFEYRGRTFRVEFPRDEWMGEPWKEHDGHGIVSDWTTRAKSPGGKLTRVPEDVARIYWADDGHNTIGTAAPALRQWAVDTFPC